MRSSSRSWKPVERFLGSMGAIAMWPRRRKKETASREAIAAARRHLERVKNRAPEVKQVTTSSREVLERNHFIEQLEEIFGGSR
jgi:hypothetical protein